MISKKTVQTKRDNFSFIPKSLEEAMNYAEMMAKSSIIPKSYQGKPGDILVAVQMGAELGLKPIQSLQNIALINGKPSIYGDACIALIQSHPEFEDIEEFFEGEGEKLTATCILKRKGKTPQKSTFSVADAQKAGLWNKPGPWTQYPKRMLQMRARGFALRNGFADALLGLILVEEAQDYRDVTHSSTNEESKSGVDRLMDKLKPDENIEIVEESPVIEAEVTDVNEDDSKFSLVEKLTVLIDQKNVPFETVKKWLDKAQVSKLSDLPITVLQKCIDYLEKENS